MNSTLIKILKGALSLGLLIWLLTRTDMGDTVALWKNADMTGIGLAFAAYTLSVVVTAYRWQILLRAQALPLSFGRAVSLYFIGNFFSNFLPTSIGGDAVRAFSAGADMGRRADAFASVFIERFVGLFAIVTLSLIGVFLIALRLEHTYIIPLTAVLFLLMVSAFPMLFSRWWVDRMKGVFEGIQRFNLGERAIRLHEILYRYGAQRGALAGSFLLSVLYQGLIVVMNIFAARALHLSVNPVYFLVFVPIIGIISMFPFSINALGFREGGYIFLFDRIGQSAPEGLALSLTLYGITVMASLPGGAFFALRNDRRVRPDLSTSVLNPPEEVSRESSGS